LVHQLEMTCEVLVQVSSVQRQMPPKIDENIHGGTQLALRKHRRSIYPHQLSVAQPADVKPSEGELKSEAYLALLGGWANNFIDGMTIGLAFGDSPLRGFTIGIAILSQQFPNEVGK
jgi:zinc transporter ZupT